ncbi:hypothetical protein DBR11_14920 [Pedobacter sp. HMWF019]|uniref:TlpA family protein disulfide reductase n=1 Tax=Pedobacter sp. HMWF019 TaxID=2056856 RepID=UPI000D3A5D67|nr:TlpA disulfide reductase family protein [Pedobacter sp. HMWF019]PTS98423.1 hypothetical protein DBR11_14920 [Pedobacter sp. HMWF019]
MNKTIKTIVMAALCLNFAAIAQNSTTSIKPIQIGQNVPEQLLENLHNYSTDPERLSCFKGKLIILDFWATWCAPCVAMFPKMEALQEQFKDKIQIIEVSYESKDVINSFLNKYSGGKYRKNVYISGDKILKKYFPHTFIPHYVWIDQSGKARAFTGASEVTAQNIKLFLDGKDLNLPVKMDQIQKYDWHYPFFEQNRKIAKANTGQFEPYKKGFASGFYVGDYAPGIDSIQRITLYNTGILWLYQMAWGFNKTSFTKARLQLNVRDSTHFYTNASGQELQNWMENGNAFSYEILFSKGKDKSAFLTMQQQLNHFLPQYEGKTEFQNKLCWVLMRTDSTINLKSKGGPSVQELTFTGAKLRNVSFKNFFDQLDWKYLQNADLPVLDETNLIQKVDMDIDASLLKITDMNKALAKYGLQFIKANRSIAVLVIRDRKNLKK